MPFVSSSIFHKAVNLALAEGLDQNLLINLQEETEAFREAKYLPIAYLIKIYEAADQFLSPGFGIRQGRQMSSDDYGTLGLSWRTCWQARDILMRTERYMILVTDHGSANIVEKEGMTHFILKREANRRGVAMANETSFVMITRILQEVTGQNIYPQRVTFKHTSMHATLFGDYFHCPVQFDERENALWFRTADLDIPTLKADKLIQQYLTERMEEEKSGISMYADTLLSEIQRLIKEALPSGIPSIIQIAGHLAISARTLKRRLSEKGKTFREMVQDVQRQEALDLLKNTRQSISEIAFLTGFSEQSAFNRAFKRWTGHAPSDLRKNA